ncbi:MAG: cupin domain-containing protein [Xanthobacteraceae bacterium]|nr:cupin domain-containing protein [Xanthobacteraceae bacterium]
MVKKLMFCVAVATVLVGVPAVAQQGEPLKRTVLQKNDFPGDKMSTLLVLIEIAPNFVVAKHTHPGIETGYVLDGEVVLAVDGQGERAVKAGESYTNPATVPHIAKGGPQGAKVIATFIVEKDKPLATPAP